VFGQSYHWSLMQVEYATDLAFRSTTTLGPVYDQLVRQSVLSVKAEQVASFLGRHITPQLAQEIGSQFSTRIEGTCIKHRFGKSSIKMYDKCGIVLRIETTTNDVSFFKHHRKVEHRDESARLDDGLQITCPEQTAVDQRCAGHGRNRSRRHSPRHDG
jgi:hypothetical protein